MQNHPNDGASALIARRRALSANRPGSRARLAGISTIALAVTLAAAASFATPANAAHSKPNEVDCPKLTDEVSSASADDEIRVEDGTCELLALSAADLDKNTPLGGGGSGGGDPGGGDPGGGDPGGGDPGGGDPGGGGSGGGGDPGGGGSASGGSAAVGDHTKTGEDAGDAGSGAIGAGEGAIGAGQGAVGAGQGAVGAGSGAGQQHGGSGKP